MRLSVRLNEPGAVLHELLVQAGRVPTIYLNGIKQNECVTVDDVAGWVERGQVNPDGTLKRDRGGDIVFERVFGKVTILLDPQK